MFALAAAKPSTSASPKAAAIIAMIGSECGISDERVAQARVLRELLVGKKCLSRDRQAGGEYLAGQRLHDVQRAPAVTDPSGMSGRRQTCCIPVAATYTCRSVVLTVTPFAPGTLLARR